jgi:hypothetical protein
MTGEWVASWKRGGFNPAERSDVGVPSYSLHVCLFKGIHERYAVLLLLFFLGMQRRKVRRMSRDKQDEDREEQLNRIDESTTKHNSLPMRPRDCFVAKPPRNDV